MVSWGFSGIVVVRTILTRGDEAALPGQRNQQSIVCVDYETASRKGDGQ